MDWKEFFNFPKFKWTYLVIMALVILISGAFADNVIYCFIAPCNQALSTGIGQKINSITTFSFEYINPDFSYINTQSAVRIKNFMRDNLGFSAGTAYSTISFIVGMIMHFLIISVISYGYGTFKKEPESASSASNTAK